jgi:glutathione synthase/RimK-type ligase-like ATP-grasp enzyme
MNIKNKYDIVILTERRYVNQNHKDNYTNNVYKEDQLVQDALDQLGLETLRISWDDEFFDWSSTSYILFSSTWDYFNRFQEFSIWLSKVTKQTTLLNSENIIRWNIDKHYLLDLQKNGVHIAKTHFIEQSSSTTLKELHNHLDWKETVLKPCISGTARHTYRLNKNNLEAHEAIFKQLIAEEAMMLLAFQYNIVEKGEISMMVFNGKFSHAVLKTAKQGDFRVQDDFGGSVKIYTPTIEEIKFAENTVKACQELPIYARVDIFTDNDDQIALLELELIEPELWFRLFPQAAKTLASAIKDKINSFL